MASQRLADKPLAMIGDKPMIAHVLESARKANLGSIILAVAEEKIAEACGLSCNLEAVDGVRAIKTKADLPSGSDRVYEALELSHSKCSEDTIILNLQGDMPFCPPEFLSKACKLLADHPEYDLATLVAPIGVEEVALASKVKVATPLTPKDVDSGRAAPAIYFSRSEIPYGQDFHWGHIGLYAWRQSALKRFVESEPGQLEKAEKLEQLRALELGMKIGCVAVPHFPLSVDTQRDLEKARDFHLTR